MIKKLWKKHRWFLILIILAAFGFNVFKLAGDILEKKKTKKINSSILLAEEFKGLHDILADIPRAGYVAEKSMDNKLTAALFAHAQLELAPIILELNNIDLPYVIFNFADPVQAINYIKKHGLIALRISSSGIVLAQNPDFS